MLVQCGSSLVVPVGTPSVSLLVNVQEGFLIPSMLLNCVLLHWLGGPGHADFFLHVAGDGPSREMQLDSASWQNGNPLCDLCRGELPCGPPQVCRHRHSAVRGGATVHMQFSCPGAL